VNVVGVVINATVLECKVPSSVSISRAPLADPHLEVSIIRSNFRYMRDGGDAADRHVGGNSVGVELGGSSLGGGWGTLTGSKVSSCPTYLQNVGAGGGGVLPQSSRCSHAEFAPDLTIGVVGSVTVISPRLLPSIGGVPVTGSTPHLLSPPCTPLQSRIACSAHATHTRSNASIDCTKI